MFSSKEGLSLSLMWKIERVERISEAQSAASTREAGSALGPPCARGDQLAGRSGHVRSRASI
jgi:hypothetical protein